MAINWDSLKQRYLQSDRSTQLESITLNLTRIQTLANSADDGQVARHLVRESQFFIEWTVPTIDLENDLKIATNAEQPGHHQRYLPVSEFSDRKSVV